MHQKRAHFWTCWSGPLNNDLIFFLVFCWKIKNVCKNVALQICPCVLLLGTSPLGKVDVFFSWLSFFLSELSKACGFCFIWYLTKNNISLGGRGSVHYNTTFKLSGSYWLDQGSLWWSLDIHTFLLPLIPCDVSCFCFQQEILRNSNTCFFSFLKNPFQ